LIPLRDSVRLTRRPLVTIALIAANLIAYLLAIRTGGSIIDGPAHATLVAYGAIPYEFAHLGSHCALGAAGFSQSVLCSGQRGVSGTAASQPATWQTAFSSMFLHPGAIAILIAMAFLAVFGATVEDTLGAPRFLAFYLLCGLGALAVTIAASPGSTASLIGAQGAVAGVLAGAIALHPRAGVLSMRLAPLRSRELPAWALLGVWLALEIGLGALHVTSAPGVGARLAAYTQLGGLGFGLITVRAFAGGGRAA
jgi:membrane associated rhomboid family serine protease